MNMKDMTIKMFSDKLSSNEPTPGGGSVAALSGTMAASLIVMVANLTIGKKGYEVFDSEMKNVVSSADNIRIELLDAIQKDSESFDSFMEAMGLPKNTDEEKEVRKNAMQKALKYAAEVPFKVAETIMKLLPFSEYVVRNGNKNAITDGIVSAIMIRSGVLSCLLNTKINLASIKDKEYVDDIMEKIKKMEKDVISSENEIFALSDLTKY